MQCTNECDEQGNCLVFRLIHDWEIRLYRIDFVSIFTSLSNIPLKYRSKCAVIFRTTDSSRIWDVASVWISIGCSNKFCHLLP